MSYYRSTTTMARWWFRVTGLAGLVVGVSGIVLGDGSHTFEVTCLALGGVAALAYSFAPNGNAVADAARDQVELD